MLIILNYLNCLPFFINKARLYTLICLIIIGATGVFPVLAPTVQKAEADFSAYGGSAFGGEVFGDQNQVLTDTSIKLSISPEPVEWTDFSFVQANSLVSTFNPPEIKVVRELNVVVTAYSSSVWETDADPHTTAAGTQVREGIVANNILPFGTKIRLPGLYGDKIFVVEDRMNSRKGDYHIDIWFPSRWEALNFGAKLTEMEIVKAM